MRRSRCCLMHGLVISCILGGGLSAHSQPPSAPPGAPGGFGGIGTIFSPNDFFWSRLLGSEKTQNELKLSEEVIAKLKELGETRQNKLRELMSRDVLQELAKLSDQERGTKAADLRKKVEALAEEEQDAIKKHLNQTQIDRFEQIALQVRGVSALDDKPLQDRLQLTLGQRDKIKATRDEATRKRNEIFQSGDWQGMREKMPVLQKETDAQMLAILTEKQVQDFDALKGPKIEGDPNQWLGGRGGRAGSFARAQPSSTQPPSGQPPSAAPGGPGGFGGISISNSNDFFWSRLLGSEKTQKELKLSEEVIVKLKELGEARRNKLREFTPNRDAFQELAKLSDKEREAKVAELRKKAEALGEEERDAIKKLLNQTQIDRLEQIALQVRGVSALDDKPLQDRLVLTPGQREKIKSIRDESAKKRNEFFQLRDRQGMREKVSALQKETDAQVLAILTERQVQDFETLKGPKIDGDPNQWRGSIAQPSTRAQPPSTQPRPTRPPYTLPPPSRPAKDAYTDEPPALRPTGLRVQHPKCTFATFSPDGRWLVTSDHHWPQSRPDSIHVWDIAATKPAGEPMRLPVPEGLRGGPPVSFDSKYLIVPCGDISSRLNPQGRVRVYELSTLKSVGEPLNLPGMNMCLAIGATGQILTAYGTGRPSTLQLWELSTGKPIGNPWTVNSLVRQIIFKPGDKEALVCTSFGGISAVQCHELSQGARVGDPWPTGNFLRLLLDSSGKFALSQSVAIGGGGDPPGLIRRWDVASGKAVGESILPQRSGPSQRGGRSSVHSAMHTDGRMVAVSTDDRTMHLFDMEAGRPIGLPLQHGEPVYRIAFSLDGKQLLTASGALARAGGCWLWDVESGKRVARIPQEGEILAVAFHPNGQMVICGNDEGEVQGWELPKAAIGKQPN